MTMSPTKVRQIGIFVAALALLFPSFQDRIDLQLDGTRLQREQPAGINFLLSPGSPGGGWTRSVDPLRTTMTLGVVGALTILFGGGSRLVESAVLRVDVPSALIEITEVRISMAEADRLISLPQAGDYAFFNSTKANGRAEITLYISPEWPKGSKISV